MIRRDVPDYFPELPDADEEPAEYGWPDEPRLTWTERLGCLGIWLGLATLWGLVAGVVIVVAWLLL